MHFVQYQDIFLVTYENGLAEYIKIEMHAIDNEQITRYDLWQSETIGRLTRFDRSKERKTDENSPKKKKTKDEATGIDFTRIPMPVFDAFRLVFIATEG